MDENAQNNQNQPENKCGCKTEHWIKFAFIALAVFLGVFFATYYIMDQIRHSYGIPYHMDNLDRILREQDRVFNDWDDGIYPGSSYMFFAVGLDLDNESETVSFYEPQFYGEMVTTPTE